MRHFTLLLILFGAIHSLHARAVRTWSYEELLNASDLVAIVKPISTEPTKDIFPDSSGRTQTDIVGQNTSFKILATLKGEAQKDTTINVLHFAYSPEMLMIANGARFAQFVPGPLQFRKQVLQDEKEIGGITVYSEQPVWLAFLKRMEDGRFEPVTPHYDSTDSFRELHQASFFTPTKTK